LRTFAEFHIKIPFYQSGQTKFADPEQAGCNHRVEDALCGKVQTSTEQPKIKICSMQNNFLSLQRGAQRRKIDIAQWIDNIISPWEADLQQTELLAIAVKAVGFGIERHAIDIFNLQEQLSEL
jgi:hypothetical protein